MTDTLLANKATTENPIAKNDTVHEMLAADISVTEFSKHEETQYNVNVNYDMNSEVINTNTDWINNRWRPVMGWVYMFICVFDFIIAPIAWSMLQATFNGQVTAPWQPLTLQGAGLLHMSFGAILGITAHGRTREKIAGLK